MLLIIDAIFSNQKSIFLSFPLPRHMTLADEVNRQKRNRYHIFCTISVCPIWGIAPNKLKVPLVLFLP
jgi:hypothetical protein